jgi:hypothetical protein
MKLFTVLLAGSLASLAFCAGAMAQQAQPVPTAETEAGTEGNSGLDTGPQASLCDAGKAWRVVGLETGESPGLILNINKRDAATGKPDCEDLSGTPDFTIGKPEDALWLSGLAGDHLILSRSTGPRSDIVVHRLTDKTVVLDVRAYEPDFDSWGITFWEQKEAATAENCPDFDYFTADGLNGIIAHESRYEFATGTIAVSGVTRCEATQ